MKLISWNVRGLNGPEKYKMMNNMIHKEQPYIIFMQETKCSTSTLESILSKAWAGCQTVTIDATVNRWRLQYDHTAGGNIGGRRKLEKESNDFKVYIQQNRLTDLPFDNDIFTWNNKGSGTQQITSRLDRFLISDKFVHLGGDICASILPLARSDHWPISLQWKNPGNSNRKPFKFEAFWLTHPEFNTIVKTTWESFIPNGGSLMYQFQQRLKYIKKQMKIWNYTIFGNIFQEKKALEQSMVELQQKIILECRTEEYARQEQILITQLDERGRQEEMLWRQKSRIRWLKEGE
eukprot:PITA_28956